MTKRQMLQQLLFLNSQVNESIQNLVSEKATEPFGKTDWLKSQELKGTPKDYVTRVPSSSEFNGKGMMRSQAPFIDPFKTPSGPAKHSMVPSPGPLKNRSYGSDPKKPFIDPFNTPREPDPAKAASRDMNSVGTWNARSKVASAEPSGTVSGPTPSRPGRPDAPAPTVNKNIPTSKLDAQVQQVTGLTFQQTKDKVAELVKNAENYSKKGFENARASIVSNINAFNADEKGYIMAQLNAARAKVDAGADQALSMGANIGDRIERGARAAGAKAVEVGKQQLDYATQHGREAMEDPKAWAKRNPGEAAKAGLAGVAAIGGSVYAAAQMAKRSRWRKNGCEGITNPDEKARCKNYLKQNK